MHAKIRKNVLSVKTVVVGAVTACGLIGSVAATPSGATNNGPSAGAMKHADASSAPAVAGSAAPLTEDEKIVHVLNRLGFGPLPGDVARVKAIGLDQYIEAQLHPESIDDSALDAKLANLPMIGLSGDELALMYKDRTAALRAAQAARKSALKDAYQTTGTGAAGATAMPPTMAAGADAADPAAADAQGKKELLEKATPEERAEIQQSRQEVLQKALPIAEAQREFVESKLLRAVESKRQLQEVMVDFWSNHFNIDMRKNACGVLKIADDRDVVRAHALGKFRDLLEASAKSPAMLVYLDNFQSTTPRALGGRVGQGGRARQFGVGNAVAGNQVDPARLAKRQGGINENYAREIMELHTLGVDGGYTQKDVTEVARCFTGWSIALQEDEKALPGKGKYAVGGQFRFYPRLHDDGAKVVLGHVIPAGGGIDDGEAVLDILANSPATMKHVSFELCQRFVSDTPPTSLVDKCAATWQRTGGDIREVVRTIVTSPEFFSRAAYMRKIKSPFEYAVSSIRAVGGTYRATQIAERGRRRGGGKNNNFKNGILQGLGDETVVGQLNTMGEPLFQYQAPTGYPEDSHKWVSSGALISRLNYSLALTGGKLSEVNMTALDTTVAGSTRPEQIVDRLSAQILNGAISPSTRASLLREADGTPGVTTAAMVTTPSAASETTLTSRMAALMLGAPEFQRR